jgi:pimeloyl-ACP methyl ester carboxylesterase
MFRYIATILVAILLSAPLVAGITPFPASFHMQMVLTNGTSLYVRVGGKGPAVVLLHGFGDTGDMWAPLAICFGQGPYRDRPRPARHGYIRSPG